jgi:Ca-activated chloride channel family protein
MNIDDPKLTAFALDELDEPEEAAVAQQVADSPEAQRYVDETRGLAAALKKEFASELDAETATAVEDRRSQSAATGSANLIDIQGDRWFWTIARPLAIAATITVAALISALAIGKYKAHVSSYVLALKQEPRFAEVEAEQSPAEPEKVIVIGSNIPTEEEASPLDLALAQKPEASSKGLVGSTESRPTVAGGSRAAIGRGIVAGSKMAPAAKRAMVGRDLIASNGGHLSDTTEFYGDVRYKNEGGIRAPNGPFNTAAYDHVLENPFLDAKSNPLSTFSIDVDTASYSNIRRFVNEGSLPPKDAVRVEEMINYFTYDYAQPNDGKPFSVQVDLASCPWESSHRLVRIGLKGKEIAMDKRGPSNLVFLLDVSGSMMPPERLPLIKQAMRLLVEKLTANDRVAIVVYAGSSGLALPSTTGDHKEQILQALESLQAGGSTNGAEGIELAYQTAQQNFIKGGVNRVILATDGDFNVGVTNQGDLIRLIEEKAKSGVFLSLLGVGNDNLKDSTMQKLADKGNGNYAYLDSLDEARKVLVQQMNGTLVTIAKDVKIQVEFNPARVASYRLIGYEKRMLRKEDFNNDKVDAGEIGAGHTVTALYEVLPVGAGANPAASVPPVDPLKYQPLTAKSAPGGSEPMGEMLTVKLRYKQPDGDKSELIEKPVTDSNAAFASASPDFKFAAAVAEFGMILRDSEHKGNGTFGAVLEWAQEGKGADANGYRAGFIELVKKAEALKKG